MSFLPYLMFRGKCAEAMDFYAEVFGTELPTVMRYSEAPAGEGMPASDLVMHAEITLGSGKLMGSDYPPGMEGDDQMGVSVMHPVPNAETGLEIFTQLREGGGEVVMEFGPTFWSDGFGMVCDRFGTHWMIAAPSSGSPESA